MPDALISAFSPSPATNPSAILIRLLAALLLGLVVAGVYRRTRPAATIVPSFPATLILLAVLIAMVTQVIGDNVARAFSLVGALSIVRFRTVVRDTQDTAYVIFAVVTGMAVGAQSLWVALIGLAVVSTAALWIWIRQQHAGVAPAPYILTLRLSLGTEPEQIALDLLDRYLDKRELVALGTARQGVAMEFIYEARLRPHQSAHELVRQLNRTEGVQSVTFRRQDFSED